MYMQSSRKSEKNGSSAKRKKSEHALQMEVASHRPVKTDRLRDKTTLLAHGRNYHRLDTLLLVVKSQPSTLQVLTRCTKLRVMVRCIQGTHTRPTAKANKCTTLYPC